jgi:glycosyltransferase involved in cell wall biosynthesis
MGVGSPDELVSVVMPVHNALPHLDAAVRSILDQSHRNIEFVIYDDGSTDGSAERLRVWARKDKRIQLHEGGRNLGPAHSSTLVVEKATSRIIARMDADDISRPDRIARELELLKANSRVGLVGSLCEIIDSNGRKLRDPEPWRVIRTSWFAPFPHGSVMFRRECFDRVGGYRPQCEYWEDQDLVLRMAAEMEILVIPQPLYQHRQSSTSTRVASDQDRVERAVDLMYRSMARLGENRGYDDLLEGTGPNSSKLDPRVFISLGSLALWSGGKPRLLRRVMSRANLGFDMRSVTALVWAGWASASPASLRLFLRLLVRVRNARTVKGVTTAEPLRWRLPDRRVFGAGDDSGTQ